MFALLARFFETLTAAAPDSDVAHSLMERAEARGGRESQELREAACAYLRVVR